MQTNWAGTRWGQGWLGIVALLAIAGCGGQASGSGATDKDETTNQGAPSGAANLGDEITTTTGGTTSSDSGVDYGPPPSGTGGSHAIGGSYAIGGAPSGPVCPANQLFAALGLDSSLADTKGKIRVTVAEILEYDPGYEAPPEVRARQYLLRDSSREWRVNVVIPGLPSDLIKVGDELDFQLQVTEGERVAPVTTVANRAFGIFMPEADLLLFGADTSGTTPIPDLAFLGLQMTDRGTTCVNPSEYAGGCTYGSHGAHLSAPGAELDLEPGQSGQLGELLVGLQDFRTVLSGAACDDTGLSRVVGFNSATN